MHSPEADTGGENSTNGETADEVRAMMGLADFGAFVAVLSLIGPVEMAVTTSLTCNFLRRPGPADLLAQARILKLGKRLAYGDVEIFSEADRGEGPVAHATATYSIPPQG